MEEQGQGKWTVGVVKSWKEVARGEHFFFLGSDRVLRKVVHRSPSGDSHQERWEVAIALIAASLTIDVEVIAKHLTLTLV